MPAFDRIGYEVLPMPSDFMSISKGALVGRIFDDGKWVIGKISKVTIEQRKTQLGGTQSSKKVKSNPKIRFDWKSTEAARGREWGRDLDATGLRLSRHAYPGYWVLLKEVEQSLKPSGAAQSATPPATQSKTGPISATKPALAVMPAARPPPVGASRVSNRASKGVHSRPIPSSP